MRELIAAPDHKVRERVTRVEQDVARRSRRPAFDFRLELEDRAAVRRGRMVTVAPRGEANLAILAEHFGDDLAQSGKMVLVNPVDEKRVRYFEFNRVGAQADGLDRLEPSLE